MLLLDVQVHTVFEHKKLNNTFTSLFKKITGIMFSFNGSIFSGFEKHYVFTTYDTLFFLKSKDTGWNLTKNIEGKAFSLSHKTSNHWNESHSRIQNVSVQICRVDK